MLTLARNLGLVNGNDKRLLYPAGDDGLVSPINDPNADRAFITGGRT